METQNESQTNIQQLDDIAKSFQREAEALREIVRNRDVTIRALKAHALCLQTSFKSILEAVVDRVVDSDVQFHAKKMIDTMDKMDVAKVGDGQ